MYGKSKKVLALVLSTFCIAIVASAVFISIDLFLGEGRQLLFSSLRSMLTCFAAKPIHLPTGTQCALVHSWNRYYLIWVPPMMYELLLVGLALYKGYQSFQSDGPTSWNGTRTMDILIQDSIMYFLVYVAFSLIQKTS